LIKKKTNNSKFNLITKNNLTTKIENQKLILNIFKNHLKNKSQI